MLSSFLGHEETGCEQEWPNGIEFSSIWCSGILGRPLNDISE